MARDSSIPSWDFPIPRLINCPLTKNYDFSFVRRCYSHELPIFIDLHNALHHPLALPLGIVCVQMWKLGRWPFSEGTFYGEVIVREVVKQWCAGVLSFSSIFACWVFVAFFLFFILIFMLLDVHCRINVKSGKEFSQFV
ncbi:hypothetical protein CEXT_194931 [Caerostris extrusa]|uniref:Uncharacterized protein n=1 Tax=Caerostris extrusa TaxID=172846 RepID=A0AAV4M6D7_CAEEX|nr:hypothetical protein CEXT_194931 [Caerostris extrusa]